MDSGAERCELEAEKERRCFRARESTLCFCLCFLLELYHHNKSSVKEQISKVIQAPFLLFFLLLLLFLIAFVTVVVVIVAATVIAIIVCVHVWLLADSALSVDLWAHAIIHRGVRSDVGSNRGNEHVFILLVRRKEMTKDSEKCALIASEDESGIFRRDFLVLLFHRRHQIIEAGKTLPSHPSRTSRGSLVFAYLKSANKPACNCYS